MEKNNQILSLIKSLFHIDQIKTQFRWVIGMLLRVICLGLVNRIFDHVILFKDLILQFITFRWIMTGIKLIAIVIVEFEEKHRTNHFLSHLFSLVYVNILCWFEKIKHTIKQSRVSSRLRRRATRDCTATPGADPTHSPRQGAISFYLPAIWELLFCYR